MSHRIAEIHIFHLPPMTLKLVADYPMEVLVVDGIVSTESRCVVVIDHGLVLMISVITAEILNESRNFTLEFDIERLDDIQSYS